MILQNKQDFTKLLHLILDPVKPYYSKEKSFLKLGATSTWYDDTAAYMEAFARPLWGLVPFWAGGGNDAEFEEIYKEGVKNGSDPKNSGYWGNCHDKDQRFVEMASIAYGLFFAKDKIWTPLSDDEKDNLCKWLYSINDLCVCDSNWLFFRILVNTALKKLGREYCEKQLENDLKRIEDFYISGGWYSDGENGQKDYYIAFAFHFYSLVYATVMKDEDSDRAKLFCSRAKNFAKTYIYWFAEDGNALPYGRSLIYRFAQISFWSMCIVAGIKPFSTGVIKGIIVRNLNVWLKSDMFDNSGILTIGYAYPTLLMSEHYNAPGSPYWSMKAFAFMMLDDDHEFWKADAEPLPELKNEIVIKQADMIIQKINKNVTAYVAGTLQGNECGQMIPKYLKFAYSSRYGFNVMYSSFSIDEMAPDNMLVFECMGNYVYRKKNRFSLVNENGIMTAWSPMEGIMVTTEISLTPTGHSRKHVIVSEFPITAYDCGFAVAQRDCDNCISSESRDFASARNNFSFCSVVSKQGDGMGHIINASPNTNLLYSKTVIPSVKYEMPKGTTVIETEIITEREDESIESSK